jgi:hypothetical protein
MNKDEFITFYLWQKMSAKGNLWDLFHKFLAEKVEKDKNEILDMWKKLEDLLDEINKRLDL